MTKLQSLHTGNFIIQSTFIEQIHIHMLIVTQFDSSLTSVSLFYRDRFYINKL